MASQTISGSNSWNGSTRTVSMTISADANSTSCSWSVTSSPSSGTRPFTRILAKVGNTTVVDAPYPSSFPSNANGNNFSTYGGTRSGTCTVPETGNITFSIGCGVGHNNTTDISKSGTLVRSSPPSYNSISHSNVTSTSVRLTASINDNGASVTDGGWDVGTSTSSFSYHSGGVTDKTITGLTRNTTYYYRGYAINSAGGANSGWQSFTTLAETPTLSAVSVSSITSSSAALSFSVSDNGGKSITSNTIRIYTNSACTNQKTSISGTSGTASGLSRYTTYYARAEASNGSYTGYSAVKEFKTSPENPTVSAITVGTLTPTTAPLSFTVTDNGGKSITANKIEVSETNFGTVLKTISSNSGTVSGLTPHKTYYARGYTTNGTTSKYTAVKSFTTTFTNPGQPGAITLTYDTPELVKRTKVTAKWTASSAGSTAVAGYRFQVYKNGTQVASTDTESTAVTKTITLSDYSFNVGDTLQIKVYAYSKCAAGDKHLSSVRNSSTVTIISDRYVWVSVNGAAFVRRKLHISNNGAAFVWVKREKIKVSSNGGTMTFPIK